ncbi:MAG: hypothetical protein IT326_10640, partial [Anaerolineae bacterium]|nr:hypothetical protein [Anaerolineae bacterium]
IISPRRDDNAAAEVTLGVAVMILDRHRGPLQDYLCETYGTDRETSALILLGYITMLLNPSIDCASRFRLSNDERILFRALSAVRRADIVAHPPLTDLDRFRYFRLTGRHGIAGVLAVLGDFLADGWPQVDAIAWGTLLDGVASPLLRAWFDEYERVVAPPPLVTGDDLVTALGLKPGPPFGSLLEALIEAQVNGEISTRAEALQLASALASRQPQSPGRS